jgi:hypothetical protein
MAAKNKKESLMRAYQKVGLDEAFATAIVEGGDAKHIVDTWKASWRGSNGAEHPAIRAVLEGKATPDEAKSLLEAAELHRDLVEAVAGGHRTMKWAHVVLSTNFKGNPDAVSALLDGADPTILSHLLDIPLTDAEAKNIGRKHHGTREVKAITTKGMKKEALKLECEIANLSTAGSEKALRANLDLYKRRLKDVLQGFTNGSYPDVQPTLESLQTRSRSTGWHRSSAQHKVKISNEEMWVSQKRWNQLRTKLYPGHPDKSRNTYAMRYLGLKTESMSEAYFRHYVLTQAQRHGLLSAEEMEQIEESSNEFNKV